jgi:hypothetical protein
VRDLVPALEKLVFDGGAEPDEIDLGPLGERATDVRAQLVRAAEQRDLVSAKEQNMVRTALAKMPQDVREYIRLIPDFLTRSVNDFAEIHGALALTMDVMRGHFTTWFEALPDDQKEVAERYVDQYLDLVYKGVLERGKPA